MLCSNQEDDAASSDGALQLGDCIQVLASQGRQRRQRGIKDTQHLVPNTVEAIRHHDLASQLCSRSGQHSSRCPRLQPASRMHIECKGVRRVSELASCTSAPTTSDGVTGAAAAEYESILGFLPGTSIGTTNISQAATGLLTIGRIRVERRREQWLPDDLYRHKSSKEE